MISGWNVLGILLTILLVIGVGIGSGRKVSNVDDFNRGGGKAGSWIVCGAILGCLVSGQATIGTAQMAFTYGLSAWWFTLGSGIGCLVLAIGYVIPLRHSGSITLLEIIGKKYGSRAENAGSVLCSAGIFISVIAQLLSSCALLTSIFPIKPYMAILMAMVLMGIYVIFGGTWGSGMGGIVELVFLYGSVIFGTLIILTVSGGPQQIMNRLCETMTQTGLGELYGIGNLTGAQALSGAEGLPGAQVLSGAEVFPGTEALSGTEAASAVSARYLNLFSRGFVKDMGSGLSMMLGVLSTQTYAQAIWAAKSDSTARKGALLTACLIPPIGSACILIGMFMRNHCITSAEAAALLAAGQQIPDGMLEIAGSAQVFPEFVIHYVPPFAGGIVLGTLLITVISGGAGLSMGMATIFVNDIFCRGWNRLKEPEHRLLATRLTIAAILGCAAVIAAVVPGAIINDFGFLSMGIRGTVVFIPMTFALFVKKRIPEPVILTAMTAGLLAVLAGKLFPLPFDTLFPGIAVSTGVMMAGTCSLR